MTAGYFLFCSLSYLNCIKYPSYFAQLKINFKILLHSSSLKRTLYNDRTSY